MNLCYVHTSSSHFHCKVPLLMSGDMVPPKPFMRHVESTNYPTKSSVVFNMQAVHLLSIPIHTKYELMVMLLE